jgi:polyhydroxybutyrate depolymerase
VSGALAGSGSKNLSPERRIAMLKHLVPVSRRGRGFGLALAALLAGALVALPSPASATCGNNTLSPGDSTISISFGGQNRSYILHVPSGYTGTTPVPLIIDMHGFTSTASQQKGLSGMQQICDQFVALCAWPSGLNNSWNAYGCCGTSQRNNVNDVGFIKAVVADIVKRGVVNEARVYATGLSNGGSMSHRIACEAGDVFATTSPVSFPLNRTSCPATPAHPITVQHYHGLNDTTVPFNGGGFTNFQSAPNSFAAWQKIDQCGTALTTETFNSTDRCDSATACAGGVTPTLCRLSGTHVLYNTQSTINIAAHAWQHAMQPFTNPLKTPTTCP